MAFQDISRYLSQNRQGAQRMGSQLANQVTQAGNQAQTNLAGTQTDFNNQVRSGTPQPVAPTPQVAPAPVPAQQAQVWQGNKGGNQNKRNQNIVNMLSQGAAPMAPQAPQPVQMTPYAGPTDLSQGAGFADTQKSIQDALGLSKQATTDAGRSDMLQSLYGGGRGYGVSALDSALLNRNAGGLEAAATGNRGLTGNLEEAQKAAAARAMLAKNTPAPMAPAPMTPAAPQSVLPMKGKKHGKGGRKESQHEKQRKIKALKRVSGRGA
jgi:hypothetical protein